MSDSARNVMLQSQAIIAQGGNVSVPADFKLTPSSSEVEALKADPNAAAMKSTIVKVAKTASSDQWADFITTGELPVVALSPREMEAMQGGISQEIVGMMKSYGYSSFDCIVMPWFW